ncbi:CHASE3 domain-containing protein [Dactylosporangium siamense]|uniref:histidine kinase n=1 Tax=Dactylosporangium siamense TaxID=685454 RepID=A0A919PWG8_9ACTN|nr:sensor histidine kinase [Dactylosporangium siamense]GIG49743.1 histidine kinase [Dactylosporangium siamense]
MIGTGGSPQRWSTQRWFASVLIAMVVLVLAGAAVGAAILAHTAAVSNRLSDRISPARTAVVELTAALVDQETGVRGYLLSGDERFLEPYARGVAGERTLLGRMRQLLIGEQVALADLDRVEAQARDWRTTVADPSIEARRRGGDSSTTVDAVLAGKTAFDAVRDRIGTLDGHLAGVREQARRDLDGARRLRDSVFLGMVGFLLLFITAIAVLLRLVVLEPLDRLSTGVRRVAGGDFDHRLAVRGPADLARLTGDVETMRQRIVDAFIASEQARAKLEQQQLELHRSNADLEQFAYVASHDLQEPLRKVASFCQMLQRRYSDQLDDKARQYIAFAVDGATRMQRLITDLLTFSRIGRVYDDSRSVDLDEVVGQAEANLGGAITERRARVERPPLPTVPGDVTLLTMLWQNLISNAIKFRHPERDPVVRVTVAEAGARWQFSVEDNGIGIDPRFADKIFVIFQRLHSRETYSGTGIGLAVCKKVVEFHGGEIRLDDTYSDGARFIFTLPREVTTPELATASADLASADLASAGASADLAPATADGQPALGSR